MPARRYALWISLLAVGGLLTACEPYMSMTDQVPAQTRRAAALLPESPQYVGMVDLESALRHLEALSGARLADSLRRVNHPHLRAFFEATGFDPGTDLTAVYGALEGEKTVSAVAFGALAASDLDRYLDRAPPGAGRATTYRGIPLYHLALPSDDPSEEADTLRVAFVGEGTMALARKRETVAAMVDRHRATASGLRSNDAYMSLVKRVGRGSTAWLVGRNLVKTALNDPRVPDSTRPADAQSPPEVSRAGLQSALSEWSDRVLGLSDVSSLDGAGASDRLGRLTRRLREQAFSIRFTETAMEGRAFLSMRDDAGASSVADVAEGIVAMLKLSQETLGDRHRDLLEEVQIDQDGSVVYIRFSLDRTLIRNQVRAEPGSATARRADPSIRLVRSTVRRWGRILPTRSALGAVQPFRQLGCLLRTLASLPL